MEGNVNPRQARAQAYAQGRGVAHFHGRNGDMSPLGRRIRPRPIRGDPDRPRRESRSVHFGGGGSDRGSVRGHSQQAVFGDVNDGEGFFGGRGQHFGGHEGFSHG